MTKREQEEWLTAHGFGKHFETTWRNGEIFVLPDDGQTWVQCKQHHAKSRLSPKQALTRLGREMLFERDRINKDLETLEDVLK